MIEVDFLFETNLVSAIEKLIRESKHKLLLVSPFIHIDNRIKSALQDKISIPNFELKILFGKNQGNYQRSIHPDSVSFFKKFPNLDIRYNERLHAKFYRNDFEFIITSINLYDYSLAQNFEIGVRHQYAMKGFMGKAADITGNLIQQGVNKVGQETFGIKKSFDPNEVFDKLFETSDKIYKSSPVWKKKNFISQELDGIEIKIDKLTEKQVPELPIAELQGDASNIKYLSLSMISKSTGKLQSEFIMLMKHKGYISDKNTITELGLKTGLKMRNYMGTDYIAYPENLPELENLKNNSI